MGRLVTYSPFIVGVALILGAGVWQGIMSERFETFPELELFAERLKLAPMKVGDWQGSDEDGPSKEINEYAGNVGTVSRLYRNASGQTVRIALVCGRLRDVYQHQPDRCYPSSGYARSHDPIKRIIDTSPEESSFIIGTYAKDEPTGAIRQRIFWSWNSTGPWVTPDFHSVAFAGSRAIYKLYVIREVPSGEAEPNDEVTVDFLRAFIPEARKVLFPTESTPAKPTTEKTTAKAS